MINIWIPCHCCDCGRHATISSSLQHASNIFAYLYTVSSKNSIQYYSYFSLWAHMWSSSIAATGLKEMLILCYWRDILPESALARFCFPLLQSTLGLSLSLARLECQIAQRALFFVIAIRCHQCLNEGCYKHFAGIFWQSDKGAAMMKVIGRHLDLDPYYMYCFFVADHRLECTLYKRL